MKFRVYKTSCFYLCLAVTICCILAACSKMDATYRPFIENGEIHYAGAVDSIKVFPGKNRIMLSWIIADPQVNKVRIYWNNKSDSLEMAIKRVHEIDTVKVILPDMREGAYSFDIYAYDDQGNRSVRVSTTGQVYGERYISSLLARPVKSALFSNGRVSITWGSADMHVTATRVKYTDAAGTVRNVTVPVDSATTMLDNYDFNAHGTFEYATLYMPDSTAIDTFYSAYETVKVKGPPQEYAKTGWTATASDYDESSNRGPGNAIDNNVATVWQMSKAAGLTYPHTITVNMGATNSAYGFTFVQRSPLDGPIKLIEIEVSTDNNNWIPLGAFTLAPIADKQYVELTEAVTFQYFRVIVKSDHKNSNFSALAEVGVYKR
ncbi:hypothetical protein HHL17_27680 [Chitinophaga sp. G-6-1-13]|uniref:F5/8 type C domain-containing protein n=1 Tax=Chitinophaga fulva TaxID=2728842 RepID=A0A848GR23_9BACT|nr:DUF4998 domain-containing protein [Chitinophaga fulva]NML41006.1 hypothetical protein [Chitinophaga fulva]